MFKKIIMIGAASLALLAGSVAHAQSFAVATGDSKGGSTYSQMFREFARVCGRDLNLVEVETTGSVENVQKLVGNEVNGAFVQSDLLAFRKMTDPDSVTNIKTLVPLHTEELHFIARADVKKEGGIFGLGANKVEFNTVDDLAGRQVGAVGGSILSGRVVSSVSGLNFEMKQYPSNVELLKGLLDGEVDSILVVAGSPSKVVQALDGRYRLLSLSDELIKKLTTGEKAVYVPKKISYSNLNQSGVPSVAVEALFVTRTYRSPKVINALKATRECFLNEVYTIQDSRGTHPKWQDVNPDNKGKWAYYDLQ